MRVKEKNKTIKFLTDRPLMNKNEGIDKDHPYIIKLPKIDDLQANQKISAFSDSMFKTMFLNENRLKYSCKLLSYYLDVSYEELLEKLTFGKNELNKDYENNKGEKADYVATFNDTTINIEINFNNNKTTQLRNLDYILRFFAKKIKKGSDYDYTQVIQININNFAYQGKNIIKHSNYIMDEEGEAMCDKIIIIQIYIPNLMKKWYNEGIEKLTEEERFLLVIILYNVDDARKIAKGDVFMNEYIDEAIIASRNEVLKEAYSKEWAYKDQGYRDGFEDGFDDGFQDGFQDGFENGRKENQRKIALNLKKDNIPIQIISKTTELSIQEIEML